MMGSIPAVSPQSESNPREIEVIVIEVARAYPSWGISTPKNLHPVRAGVC